MFKRAVNAILAVREPLRHKYIHPICRTGCSLQSCIRRKTDYLLLWKSGWGTEGKWQCLPRPQRCCWLDDIIDQMDILQPVPSSARTQTNREPQRLPVGTGGWMQRSGQTPALGTRGVVSQAVGPGAERARLGLWPMPPHFRAAFSVFVANMNKIMLTEMPD